MNPRSPSLVGAVMNGDTEAVRALLAAGANVNQGSGGPTPLILSIVFGRTQIMTLLLEAGADPQQRDSLGLNAIDWAQRKGFAEGVKLLTQRQAQKQENPLVTPGRETTPPVGLAPSQSENETTRDLRASTPSANADEKSRQWLAGFKRRIDEEESRKIKEGEPTPATPEVEITSESEPPQILVNDNLVEAAVHEPEPAVISAPVAQLPNFPEASLKNEISPAEATDLLEPSNDFEKLKPPAPKIATPPPRVINRKRCPKCNTVYRSEILAYCAIDATPLVDANQPVSPPPPETAGRPLLWSLVVFTFIAAFGVTYLMMSYFRSEPKAPTATSPPQARNIPDAPAVRGELSGKQLEVPAAEYPPTARSENVFGTVTVQVTVNKEGKVIAAQVLDGDRRLRKAAIAAALKATFSAEKLVEGKTVGTIAYTFRE